MNLFSIVCLAFQVTATTDQYTHKNSFALSPECPKSFSMCLNSSEAQSKKDMESKNCFVTLDFLPPEEWFDALDLSYLELNPRLLPQVLEIPLEKPLGQISTSFLDLFSAGFGKLSSDDLWMPKFTYSGLGCEKLFKLDVNRDQRWHHYFKTADVKEGNENKCQISISFSMLTQIDDLGSLYDKIDRLKHLFRRVAPNYDHPSGYGVFEIYSTPKGWAYDTGKEYPNSKPPWWPSFRNEKITTKLRLSLSSNNKIKSDHVMVTYVFDTGDYSWKEFVRQNRALIMSFVILKAL